MDRFPSCILVLAWTGIPQLILIPLVPQLMRKHFGPIELGEWSVEDSYHEDGYRKRRRW